MLDPRGESMANPVPAWKFWHPLPFWHVILIFVATNVLCFAIVVALREGMGVQIPAGAGGGAGGLLGVLSVIGLAKKKREQLPPA
jgi:hypothetical protein